MSLFHLLSRTPEVATEEVFRTPRGEQEISDVESPNRSVAGRRSLDNDLKHAAFKELGNKIKELIVMLEDGKRRSIHQPMRDVISSISKLYEQSSAEMLPIRREVIPKTDSCSQTTPVLQVYSPRSQGKREEASTASSSNIEKASIKQNSAKKKAQEKQAQIKSLAAPANNRTDSRQAPTSKDQAGQSTSWQVVKGRRELSKRKVALKHPKPDALVIRKQEVGSYAEILKKVKTDPSCERLMDTVHRIRRTQKGDLLLELNSSGDKTERLRTVISSTLGGEVDVRSLTQKTALEIKDLDEITTKEDICQAIMNQYKEVAIQTADVVSLRRAYAGMQSATVMLPTGKANILLKAGKIKIGWVVCRIRLKCQLKKCFRCLEYGHFARDCKGNVDRSKCCIKCGAEGHIAKVCEKDPKCMLCAGKYPYNASHVTGSRTCPAFKAALNLKKR